ncbi:hypothetical protein DVH24_013611 [Malus domestica]|uniref:CCAAT-binding factor domain-containing protein n=1 Tax=Malus domestica TaxID=3750 RepID=A0A498JDU9_MALDO|nr:hypothetical protein DVH24_013611 [Malus domestica]
MEFVMFGNGGKFHSTMYHRLLRSIVYTTSPVDLMLDLLSSKYFKYIDVRDFLTRSYDIGGVISVMALSSLFILMTQHGLEYPNFYEKLYALLVPSIFLAKHRSKFFQLVDACLKSPLLPAYLAAAFAKKLSRLSISVPPSGALVNIALGGGDETVKDDPEAEQRSIHLLNGLSKSKGYEAFK